MGIIESQGFEDSDEEFEEDVSSRASEAGGVEHCLTEGDGVEHSLTELRGSVYDSSGLAVSGQARSLAGSRSAAVRSGTGSRSRITLSILTLNFFRES